MQWHERSSPLSSGGYSNWGPRCHAYFQGFNLVGAALNTALPARIAVLDSDYHYDNGRAIQRIRSSPHIFNKGQFVTVSSVEFLFQAGTGIESSADPEEKDPLATLRVSKDGGKTYGFIRSTPIGKQGEYKTRCQFNRLGRARDFVVELSISAPVQIAITDATLAIEP